MTSVEFQKQVTSLTKNLTDIDRSIMRAVLQKILIDQLSIYPEKLEMVMVGFRKYLWAYEKNGFTNLGEIMVETTDD